MDLEFSIDNVKNIKYNVIINKLKIGSMIMEKLIECGSGENLFKEMSEIKSDAKRKQQRMHFIEREVASMAAEYEKLESEVREEINNLKDTYLIAQRHNKNVKHIMEFDKGLTTSDKLFLFDECTYFEKNRRIFKETLTAFKVNEEYMNTSSNWITNETPEISSPVLTRNKSLSKSMQQVLNLIKRNEETVIAPNPNHNGFIPFGVKPGSEFNPSYEYINAKIFKLNKKTKINTYTVNKIIKSHREKEIKKIESDDVDTITVNPSEVRENNKNGGLDFLNKKKDKNLNKMIRKAIG